MLNIAKRSTAWKEGGSLNAHISLYGFWSDTATLTKSGDVMMILSVPGVDYESLDSSEQQYAVRRLESALKAFGKGYTAEYLEASSPRSQQIRDYLEATGYQGPAAAQIAAHDTRDKKDRHPPA